MANGPVKAMGSGCFGGLLGAILGIVIGGFIGPVIATSGNGKFRSLNDPMAKNVSGMIDACGSFVGLVLGSGLGGIIGGIGGAVFGTGFAARTKGTGTEEAAVEDVRPANTLEPPTESPEAELRRLKERIAELDEFIEQKDVPPKEE
jgi:hypothetical protein